jgi:PAS domain S-box-containing protein
MAIRILLADDHKIMRQGLHALLEREPDMEVVSEAGDAGATVQMARELSPEVVVMDLAMPGLNGNDIVREVITASPGVKVIALSMHSDRRLVVNVLKSGASGFLLKDCAFEELALAIRTVQGHKTYISPGISDIVVQDYLEALRESEARFRTIFAHATIGMALVDLDGRIVESNPALQEMLGVSREQMYNRVFHDFTGSADAERCTTLFKDLVTGKRPSFQVEKEFTRQDGRRGWGRLTVSPFRVETGDLRFAIAMVEDITDQKQAEAEISTYQEQLRSMASDLSLAEERERRRLATELHDHVGQILALAQIKLGALRESANSNALLAPMDEIRRLIEQTIQYTRSLTFELSPPILYDLGFEAAVEWLADTVREQHGILIQVSNDAHHKPMNDEFRVLLFQAVRELLFNVVKHAKALVVKVSLNREGMNLRVQVADDGVGLGIDPKSAAAAAQGFGLFSIRERLKHLGGNMEVESEPGRGTQVTLTVPLKY